MTAILDFQKWRTEMLSYQLMRSLDLQVFKNTGSSVQFISQTKFNSVHCCCCAFTQQHQHSKLQSQDTDISQMSADQQSPSTTVMQSKLTLFYSPVNSIKLPTLFG